MPIDTSILSGLKPLQIESPMNQLGKMYELQNAQQANQLGALKMQEAQRSMGANEQLRQLYGEQGVDQDSPEFARRMGAISPAALEKHQAAIQARATALSTQKLNDARAREAGMKTEAEKRAFMNGALRDISLNPSDANISAYGEDMVIKGIQTPEQAKQSVAKLLSMPMPQRQSYLAAQGASSKETMEMFASKPIKNTDNATTWMEEGNPRLPTFGAKLGSSTVMQAAPAGPSELAKLQTEFNAAVPGSPEAKQIQNKIVEITSRKPTALVDEFNFAKTPEGGGFTGTLFDFKRKIAEAGRTPAQPVAPTLTEIQDPTDPSKMIRIDARAYRGGGVGSPGVIGTTGKTPAATATQEKIDKGQAQVSDVLDSLRAEYQTLDKLKAIPSTTRGGLSNLGASMQASGLGQALGRAGGTEAQSSRDTISSSRLMLLNAIKQATGMSAQQLNSNVELQTWLKAVSDPSQSVETVDKILGNIEKFVGSGGKRSDNIHDKADAILRGGK